MFWIYFLFYSFAFGTVTAIAANSKQRDPMGWFFLGLFFGVFALIAILVISENEDTEQDSPWKVHSKQNVELPKLKKCPDCAEEIKLEAIVCRFCGKRFTEIETNQPEQAVQQNEFSQSQTEKADFKVRNLRCPHCYTKNYYTDISCSACGKDLPYNE